MKQKIIIHQSVVDYLEHEFVKDWVAHGHYHNSTHCSDPIEDEATCFIQWIKDGKPTVTGE